MLRSHWYIANNINDDNKPHSAPTHPAVRTPGMRVKRKHTHTHLAMRGNTFVETLTSPPLCTALEEKGHHWQRPALTVGSAVEVTG